MQINMNQAETADKPSKDLPLRFIWEESSKIKLEAALKCESSKMFFEDLSTNTEISPDILVSKLTDKILTCATEGGLKTIRQGGKAKTANSPWFDKECAKLKKNLKYLARSLKLSPNNTAIRVNVFLAKKEFQSMIKKKKTHISFQ